MGGLALAAALAASAERLPAVNVAPAAEGNLSDEGFRNALRTAGLSDDPAAPWTPDRITLAGLYFDPALRTARLTAEVAIADATVAAQRQNPTFSLNPERVISGAVGSPWTVVAALAIPLMRPAELAPRREAARLDAEAARLDLGAAFWQTRARSLAALRKTLVSREAEKRARQSAEAQAAWAENVRKRLALGAADRGELAAAQSAAIAAAADSAARAGRRIAAERGLATALGISPMQIGDMQLEWPDLQQPPAPGTVQALKLGTEALNNRLELRNLELKRQAAEARWREARAGRVPKTGITPSATHDQETHKIGLGGDVEVPLFHGPGAAIRRAEAARSEATARLDQQKVGAVSLADTTAAEYASRYAEWQSLNAGVTGATASESQAQRALAVGEGDRPTLLQAAAHRAALEVQTLDALQAALDALAAVEDAIERPIWPVTTLTDVRTQAVP